ncbi:steroidogenic acute regulatory protein, mitochondrial-like [Calypte anna]|uniref:steroidogenic acute regulatory protein, mitochondrial-like n=1 Tax=Calypte anna TaxID=9244 RepID=UPI0011C41088|nr:steroidogenic acute regulatory protein, mitochondrial-like [Calypte anna]
MFKQQENTQFRRGESSYSTGTSSKNCMAKITFKVMLPATCLDPNGDTNPSPFSSLDLPYITQGERALQQALSRMRIIWQAETMTVGGPVSSATLPRLGRLFWTEVVLAVPMAQLYQELFERMEQMPQWNPALSQVKEDVGD